jgi:putative serine protease PepD
MGHLSIVSAVPIDDDHEEGSELGPPPPADDRLWRHPSEMGGAMPVRIVTARPSRRRSVTIGVVSGLVGAAAMLAALVAVGALEHRRTTVAVEQVKQPLSATSDSQVAAVTAKVLPALARVDAMHPTGTISASAVVFRSDGYLLTTADAVSGASGLNVQLSNGTTMPARLVGVDPSSDVAVIKVDQTQMRAAVLADEDDIQLGEPAVAIDCISGRPATPDVSVGLISALGRRVASSNGTMLPDMIQTSVRTANNDAAAVLVDSSGAVMGLLTAGGAHLSGVVDETTTVSSGGAEPLVLRYATPVDYASKVADELIATGKVAHPWLGVEASDLTGDQLADAGQPGARIDKVIAASPALHAGLLVGDVVVSVDGTKVTSSSELTAVLRQETPRQSIKITYLRDGTRRTTIATLSERDN